jgi:hypothetical protein
MTFRISEAMVIVGLGEMGELFASGFLKAGYPVFPVSRETDWFTLQSIVPAPSLVLMAVGETQLDDVLKRLPLPWRKVTALLQNELLPCHYLHHGIIDPTIITVWFDKKKGRPSVSVLPTVISGPKATLIQEVLEKVEVASRIVPLEQQLFEMIRKNLYILTINIGGIVAGGSVSSLWSKHRELAEGIASDILSIQEALVGKPLPREALLKGMVEGFEGDPEHLCMGRSAPDRLRRALSNARTLGLSTPWLDQVESRMNPASSRDESD